MTAAPSALFSAGLVPFVVSLAFALGGVGYVRLARPQQAPRIPWPGAGVAMGVLCGWGLLEAGRADGLSSGDWAVWAGVVAALSGLWADPLPAPTPARSRKGKAATSDPVHPGRWVPGVVAFFLALGLAGGPGDAFFPRSVSTRVILAGTGAFTWLGVSWWLHRAERVGRAPVLGYPGAALGVALVAWIVDRADVALPALALTVAMLGCLGVHAVSRSPIGPGVRVAGLGVLMPLAITLVLEDPDALVGVVVAGLALMADAPAPVRPNAAGGAVVLRWLAAAGTGLGPVPVAGALAVVSAGMPPG
ncbi:hypothetical protein [Pararhodospirillum photometricum]|uniref:hypothetical protein n=1 Tax=Pararhodospirillum photometricum TaxID=1084 RepID=UPI0002F64A77|nr:hypothetical protein [Pararhodospirillum photometricum]